MQKKIKSYMILEDGYIVLQLAKKSDADTYMASLIHKNQGLLPCVQDQKVKSKFYYDRRNYASLLEVFQTYYFPKYKAILFLKRLFTLLKELEEEYPIILEMSSVYVQSDLESIAVVALPIHEHQNSENDYGQFLKEIMSVIQGEDEITVLGRLAMCQREPALTSIRILQELEKEVFNPFLMLRGLMKKKLRTKDIQAQNDIAIQTLFSALQMKYQVHKPTPPIVVKKEVFPVNETVGLFATKKVMSVLKDTAKNTYVIDTNKRLGRGMDCDIQIDDPTISSHHACLYVEKGKVYLEDVNSSNGTCINKEAIKANERYVLRHLDQLDFADYKMVYYEESV